MASNSCVTTSLPSPPSSSSQPLPTVLPVPSALQGRNTNGLVDGELPVEAGPQLLQFLILALLELDPVLQLLQPVFQLLNMFLESKKTRVDYLGEEGCLGAHALMEGRSACRWCWSGQSAARLMAGQLLSLKKTSTKKLCFITKVEAWAGM